MLQHIRIALAIVFEVRENRQFLFRPTKTSSNACVRVGFTCLVVGVWRYLSYLQVEFTQFLCAKTIAWERHCLTSNTHKKIMGTILETICTIAAFASLLAFVVGMFSPTAVKCKTRGQVALLYIFIFFVIIYISPSPTREIEVPVTSSEETHPRQEKHEPAPVESEASIGVPVEAGHFIYTVQKISYKKSVGDSFNGSTADGIYLLVDLSIKNISDETRTLDGTSYYVTNKNGVKYEYSVDGATSLEMAGKNTIFLKECQPNITTTGVVIFEVPQKDEYYLHLAGDFWGRKSSKVLLK